MWICSIAATTKILVCPLDILHFGAQSGALATTKSKIWLATNRSIIVGVTIHLSIKKEV